MLFDNKDLIQDPLQVTQTSAVLAKLADNSEDLSADSQVNIVYSEIIAMLLFWENVSHNFLSPKIHQQLNDIKLGIQLQHH